MARDSSGNYTLAAGNPVVTGTTIESVWANGTMTDLATAMTDSLSRSGLGGMNAPLRGLLGSALAPAFSFSADTNTGLFSPGADQLGLATAGALRLTVAAAGNVTVAAPSSGVGLTVGNFAGSPNVVATLSAETTFSGLQVNNAAGNRRLELLYLGSSGGGAYGAAAGTSVINAGGTALTLSTSDAARLVLSSTGNITINAPTSGNALTVNQLSDGRIVSTTTGSNLTSFRAENATHTAYLGVYGAATYVGARTNSAFEVYTNDVLRTTWSSAGNVTINAPASGVALTVNGVGTSPALLLQGPTNSAQARWLDGVVDGYIGVGSFATNSWNLGTVSNHPSGWYTNGLQRVLVAAAGNVTINAPASGRTLQLEVPAAQTGLYINAVAASTAAQVILGAATGIDITSGSTTTPCIALRGNTANAEAMEFDSNVTTTGSTAPVLTANKPGAGTAILTWVRVDVGGTRGWIPIWAN